MVKWGIKYSDDDFLNLLDQLYKQLGNYKYNWYKQVAFDGTDHRQRFTVEQEFNIKYHLYTDHFDWENPNVSGIWEKYPGIDFTRHYIPEGLHLRGVWPKLSMFSKDFPVKGNVLYFDLDTIVRGDLAHMISSVDWFKLTMVDSHWKKKSIITHTNYDVVLNSSVLAFNTENPAINKIWDHFQHSGLRDYFLRKYVKGIDRYIYHERKQFKSDILDLFRTEYIRSYKYEEEKPAPIITFEELDFGSIGDVQELKAH